MEKKTYWWLQSNGDLSVTCNNIETCMDLLFNDFGDTENPMEEKIQYTITPVYYTDEEYAKLPEWEN